MNRFLHRLTLEPFLVLDGGLATELESDGFELNNALWSASVLLTHPQAIAAVHRRYVDAGADIVTTATYQATLPGLQQQGLSRAQAQHLFQLAANLARDACTDHTIVAGSLGSYAASQGNGAEYRGSLGTVTQTALVDFHRHHIDCLAPFVDVLAFETIGHPREADAIIKALNGIPTPAWLSFVTRNTEQFGSGDAIASALIALCPFPLAAFGFNCIQPSWASDLLQTSHQIAPERPLVIYPNAGESFSSCGWEGPALSPSDFVQYAQRWLELGAKVIGGCCRTTPAHIQALATLRDNPTALNA